MDCPDENALLDLMDGRLPEAEQAAVHQHLRGCERCRQLLVNLAEPAGEVDPDPQEPVQADVGQRVGRFVLKRMLGAGAMGVVFAADDPELKRTVAIKLLRPQLREPADRASHRERLIREAQAMARLSHPHVVAVYDVLTWEGQVCVAMEYIEGQTLKSWLRERPRSTGEILERLGEAGHGLGAAHSAGIVHRDFKPDNVLVGKDGRVRVTDFGLARSEQVLIETKKEHAERNSPGEQTRTGALVGTPAYMAPEQWRGEVADARSDQFSFCVTLYEALCGVRPFQAETPQELLRRIEAGPPSPSPDKHVPAEVVRLLRRGLAAKPEDRFENMDALLANFPPRPGQVRRGRKRLVALGALLSFAVIGGFEAAHPLAHWLRLHAGRRPRISVVAEPTDTSSPDAGLAADKDPWVVALGEPLRNGFDLALLDVTRSSSASAREAADGGAEAVVRVGLEHVKEGDRDRFRVTASAWREPADEKLAEAKETVEPGALLDAVTRLSDRLRPVLDLPDRTGAPLDAWTLVAAERLRSEAVVALDHVELGQARALLEGALALRPDSGQVLVPLALTLWRQGEDAHAASTAEKAWSHADQLDPATRLEAELILHESHYEWTQALALAERLANERPQDLYAALRKLEIQIETHELDAARQTRKNLELRFADRLNDVQFTLVVADLNAEEGSGGSDSLFYLARKARAAHQQLLLARLSLAMYDDSPMGDAPEEFLPRSEAEPIVEQAGDRLAVASTEMTSAFVMESYGVHDAALRSLNKAETLARDLGCNRLLALILSNQARVLLQLSQFDVARKHLEEARELSERTRRRGVLARVLTNLANLDRATGDIEGAVRNFSASVETRPEDEGRFYTLLHLASAQIAAGRPREARKALAQAQTWLDAHPNSELGIAVELQQGELALSEGNSRLALRQLDHGVRAAFGSDADKEAVLVAASERVELLLARGQVSEARKAVDDAASWAHSPSTSPDERTRTELAEARVSFADHPSSRKTTLAGLNQSLKTNTEMGRVEDRFLVLLTLGELQLQDGSMEAGRATLQQLAQEATSRGYLFLAAQARAALEKGPKSKLEPKP